MLHRLQKLSSIHDISDFCHYLLHYTGIIRIFTARKRSLRRLCFYTCLSFILFTGGACVVAWGGMHGCSGGHAWLLQGGMCGCSRGGHAWLLGGCMVSLGGCAWLLPGVCVVAPGACMGYDEICRYGQWAGGTHPTGMHSCHLLLWCLLNESYIFMFHNISYYITILLLPSWKKKCFEWNTENCIQAWAKIMEKVTKQSRRFRGFLVKKWSDIFNTKTKPISLFLNLLSNSLECINKKVRKFDYIRVRFIDHTLNNVKPYLKCLGWDDTQFPMTSWSFYSFILLHRK